MTIPKTQFVDSNGVKIAYKTWERGSKNHVLFLPGHRSTMVTSGSLFKISELCEDLKISLTTFDYAGWGESEGENKLWQVETWIRNISDVIENLFEKKSVILIGSSMSCFLPLMPIKNFPTIIKKFIGIVPGFGKSFYDTRKILELKDVQNKDSIKLKIDNEGKAFINSELNFKNPVYLIQGMKDKKVSSKAAQSIIKNLPQKTLKNIYEINAEHSGINGPLNNSKAIEILKEILS